jgi:hypothetical protein
MPELLLQSIEKVARRRVLPSLRHEFKIVQAKLGDSATVMGAAALAQQVQTEKSSQPMA